MSYVPKEWAKTGGEFWTPKAPIKAVAAKKPADCRKARGKERAVDPSVVQQTDWAVATIA